MTSEDDSRSENGWTRREFAQILAGLGVATGTAFGGWGILELVRPKGRATSWRKSVCRFCGVGCGVRLGLNNGAITEVRGDEEAHNKGVICIKGAMLGALPSLTGRALKPKIRRAGKLVEATWEEAMSLVADRFSDSIREFGPDSVAFYGSGQLYTEETYTANKLFKAGIGTNNVDGNPRLCMASAAVGYVQTFGKDEPPGALEDIDHAHCFFIIGANPYECHPSIFERIMQRKRSHPDTVLICVDPRRTSTADRCDLHLPLNPGTDLLLLNAMMHVILEDRLYDRDFIDEHVRFSDGEDTVDFQALENFLRDYRPEDISARVGLSAEVIRRTAHLFARSKGTVSLWTMGINQRVQGVHLNNTINSLHLVTGQICRPGATPLSLTGQANACGGVRDTGGLAHLLPAGRIVANEKHRHEVEELWGVPRGTISPTPGLDAVNLFRAMEDGRVRATLVMCTNPAQSLPAAGRYRKAMERCFLVVAEAFEDSETARFADVLLPAALWVEKEGVFGQTDRRYQLVEKVLDPPGEARSDLEILVDLAIRLRHGDLIKARTPESVWDEWRKFSETSAYNFKGITYDRLQKNRGLQWPCPNESHPGTVRRYLGGDDPLVSSGKKIEFYGHPDGRAVVYLRRYLESPEQVSDEFPFILTTGRVLEQWHTATITGRIPELQNAAGPARFEFNDQDAQRMDIQDGTRLEVTSRYGTVAGAAVVTGRPRKGTIFAAFYDTKLLVNIAVADNYDAVSKQPEYKITAVSVRKMGGQ
ncbi:MAG: nitrate reductase [Armatimonadetes bacterium]|nr:nitrate reductase [Armatimonadota bacterium]